MAMALSYAHSLGEKKFRSVFHSTYTQLQMSGVLACLDGYMNIAMEQTEEYVDGQLKAKYGDCFIRGNNGKCHVIPLALC